MQAIMAITALQAGKRLLERSGWRLSNLELQKILFLAHMVYLGRHGGEPLINESFQAWDFGPVVPSLFHRVKPFGADPIENVFHGVPDLQSGPEADILDLALDRLGYHPPAQLVAMTHREGGAWAKHYQPGVRGVAIPNEAILEEYRERLGG